MQCKTRTIFNSTEIILIMETQALNQEDKKKLYITKFDLSNRCHNFLRDIGKETLGQLTEMNRSQLLKYRNVGMRTVEELDALLEQNGLSWKFEELSKKVTVRKKPLSESEILKTHEKLKNENRKLREEVEILRDVKFKDNLEKLRLERKINELEEKNQKLTEALIKK